MIKARARIGARDMIIFGLDSENMRRMLDNKPIMFNGSEVGLPGVSFAIIGGETLDDVREDLRAIGVPIPA